MFSHRWVDIMMYTIQLGYIQGHWQEYHTQTLNYTKMSMRNYKDYIVIQTE